MTPGRKNSALLIRLWALPVAIALITHPQSQAQTAATTAPSFDVASLKPVQPSPPYAIDLGNSLHGRVTLSNVTLTECLEFAFNIHNSAQIAGPDWIRSRSALFDIVGQAPPDTPKDQLRLMTLTLLNERFRLSLRHEQKELSYLALAVDKKGSKLHPAKDGADTAGSEVRAGRIIVNSLSMTALAVFLARFTGAPVLDMTRLKGSYEVRLQWTPENLSRPQPADGAQAADIAAGPSVYTALTEQLGLKLEARRGPQDTVVVEHAERTPLGN